MKRAILIATGTVGGLGAVLAITPPTFTSTTSSPMALPGGGTTPAASGSTPVATQSATPTKSATAAATKKATPGKTAAATHSAAPNNSQSQSPVATQTPTVAPATKAATGTFTGDVVNVRYGNVQVKITVENGKITDAQAVQAPSGRNDRWTQMAVPILRQQTLQAQSAHINGASGASFTSYGWYTSLVSALAKAGL
jgi:uncharacterized protein with FMN-binding domain